MQSSSFLLQGFLLFCKLLHTIERTNNYLYKNVAVVRYLTNFICYISKYIYCRSMSQRIEPFGDSWSSKCWMTLYDDSLTQSHQYHEVYETENMIECVFNFVDHFMTIFYGQHQVEVIPQKIEKMNHFLPITMINPTVIVKTTMPSTDPCYVVAFQDVSNCEPEMDNLRKSKASFLTIEYRHPEMENPIDFSLDKQWMISGNVLFSPVFVLRMLEYQSRMYYYDDRYTIRIIDKDINIYDFGMDK